MRTLRMAELVLVEETQSFQSKLAFDVMGCAVVGGGRSGERRLHGQV